jgi:hypothetical protein
MTRQTLLPLTLRDGGSGAGAFAHLLDERVHITWPYLKEAVVVAVSDAREKITGRNVHTPHTSSEWGAEVQRVAHEAGGSVVLSPLAHWPVGLPLLAE